MIRTRVGYTGGTKENPTYRSLGGHSEAIQIDYDPTLISYEELLDVFWASHDPTAQSFSRQYASILFYHDDTQKKLALESKAREAARRNKDVVTKIVPASTFTLAEDYHQKYYMRAKSEYLREFEAMYPDNADLVHSTAAARVNGYLGGYGTLEALHAEIGGLGLSQEASEKLLRRMGASADSAAKLYKQGLENDSWSCALPSIE